MAIGQAYKKVLTQRTQEVLAAACNLLIDQRFDALEIIKEPQGIAYTIFSAILPERYTCQYTPLYFQEVYRLSTNCCLEVRSTYS